MKIKIRQDDACSAEISDWHEMNDWIAELRDDSRAEPPATAVPSQPATAAPHLNPPPLPRLRTGSLRAPRPVPAPR